MAGFENAYALVVGIAQYRHVTPLSLVVRDDAQAVAQLLTDPHYCGYGSERVRLLIDEQATRSALEAALDDLARQATRDCTVLIYFSCHGGQIAIGARAGAYLLPMDARLESEQALSETALSSEALTAALRAVPAHQLIVLLDCCFAGGIGQLKDATVAAFKFGLTNADYARLGAGSGRVILAAARADQPAWIQRDAPHSLFTQCLLDGLRGGVGSEDGLIHIFALYDFIEQRVRRAEARQQTVLKGEIESNFAVSLAQGGQRTPAIEPVPAVEYDAYISYARGSTDEQWLQATLLPHLRQQGLRIALAHRSEEPGVVQLVGIENIIHQARRIVILLSSDYLDDPIADYTNALVQSISVMQRQTRLVPVLARPMPLDALPWRLRMLSRIDLTDPEWLDSEMTRLITALRMPLP